MKESAVSSIGKSMVVVGATMTLVVCGWISHIVVKRSQVEKHLAERRAKLDRLIKRCSEIELTEVRERRFREPWPIDRGNAIFVVDRTGGISGESGAHLDIEQVRKTILKNRGNDDALQRVALACASALLVKLSPIGDVLESLDQGCCVLLYWNDRSETQLHGVGLWTSNTLATSTKGTVNRIDIRNGEVTIRGARIKLPDLISHRDILVDAADGVVVRPGTDTMVGDLIEVVNWVERSGHTAIWGGLE